jgi:hypothetical protein
MNRRKILTAILALPLICRLAKQARCNAMSYSIAGHSFRCNLQKGHAGLHEVTAPVQAHLEMVAALRGACQPGMRLVEVVDDPTCGEGPQGFKYLMGDPA